MWSVEYQPVVVAITSITRARQAASLSPVLELAELPDPYRFWS